MMPTTIVKAKPWSTSPPKKKSASAVRSAVPEFNDGRGAEVGVRADGERVTRVHLGQLVNGDVVGKLVEPCPAQLLAPGNAQEPELAHAADIVPRKGGGAVELAGDGFHLVARELADGLADLLVHEPPMP